MSFVIATQKLYNIYFAFAPLVIHFGLNYKHVLKNASNIDNLFKESGIRTSFTLDDNNMEIMDVMDLIIIVPKYFLHKSKWSRNNLHLNRSSVYMKVEKLSGHTSCLVS